MLARFVRVTEQATPDTPRGESSTDGDVAESVASGTPPKKASARKPAAPRSTASRTAETAAANADAQPKAPRATAAQKATTAKATTAGKTPAVKKTTAPRTTAAKTTPARGAAAKTAAESMPAKTTAAKATAAKTTAAKTTAAKTTADKATAAKTTAAKTTGAKATGTKTTAAKATAAKTAAPRTTAARTTTAKTAAAKKATATATAAKTEAEPAAKTSPSATTGSAKKPAAKKPAAKRPSTARTQPRVSPGAATTGGDAPASGDDRARPVLSNPESDSHEGLPAREGEATMTRTDEPTTSGAEAALSAADVPTHIVDVVTTPDVSIDHTPDTALGGPAASESVDATNAVATAELAGSADAAATSDAEATTDSDAPTDVSVDEQPAAGDDVSAAPDDDAPAAEAPTTAEPAGETAATRAEIRPREEVTGPRESAPVDPETAVLVARGLVKTYGGHRAVDGIDLTIPAGTFYGIVGPNGAGKTTTLSMLSGLLRPDEGTITVGGIDVASDPRGAKRIMGVLPDRFRTFDRLTGTQLLHYYGVLRGLKPAIVDSRAADLARAFDLTSALGRSVSDYSAGMTKKVMLAGALIHSPRVLILDEPFESVDPVSSAVILDILTAYVGGGGTVILSAHGLDLVEKVCSRVAFVVGGHVLAEGDVDDVRGGLTLEERFVQLSGGASDVEGLEWLHTFSD